LIKPYLALAGGIIALTLSPLFVRFADAPGIVTSFYRMLIASCVLFPFVLLHKPRDDRAKPKLYFLYPIIAGAFTGFDHIFWSTAIERTTVANATLLNNISSLWVALFAVVILRVRLSGRFWLGLIAILAGASAVLGSTILIRPNFTSGDLLAIVSSVFYAGYYLVTQRGRRYLDTLPYLSLTTLTACVSLLLTTQAIGVSLTGYSQSTYLVFLAAALVSQLGGYVCITYALGELPPFVVAPTMVGQPILTALLAIPLANEPLLLSQSLGGVVTLLGIYFVNSTKQG
jgi:drug/metabolite transporter (DMT)-like permease